ncbi:EamA family transporter [Microbacterium sp. NPDC076911]|uniref:EamA family transporter n=1 Tax=Microbacterium sp. NPDC076911 TaxID=3154958 RepID=UPI0034284046
MLSKLLPLILLTAVAPALWGTTYFTATALLLPGHPMLNATLRALPAGLVLLAWARRLPHGSWWWKSLVLGTMNITIFFACLFIAAERLPGGVAAVLGGVQPLLVAVIAWHLLSDRINVLIVGAGLVGALGVGLVVLRANAALDPVGIAAALLGALCMASGTVLAKKWGTDLPPVATTSWQLLVGGLSLTLLTAFVEPLPTTPPTATNLAGYAYLALIGTAFAYLLWFRGVRSLPVRIPAFLGLLSPIVAITLGTVAAGEELSCLQLAGIALILGSVLAIITSSMNRQSPAARVPGS